MIHWGTALAMMRLSSVKALSWFAAGYVNLFRAVPLVMVLLWFFLIVPRFIEALLDLLQPLLGKDEPAFGYRGHVSPPHALRNAPSRHFTATSRSSAFGSGMIVRCGSFLPVPVWW